MALRALLAATALAERLIAGVAVQAAPEVGVHPDLRVAVAAARERDCVASVVAGAGQSRRRRRALRRLKRANLKASRRMVAVILRTGRIRLA
eukprot:1461649-Pleurochrysis_carterae.AAC.2